MVVLTLLLAADRVRYEAIRPGIRRVSRLCHTNNVCIDTKPYTAAAITCVSFCPPGHKCSSRCSVLSPGQAFHILGGHRHFASLSVITRLGSAVFRSVGEVDILLTNIS